jgi:hypothetical protein
MRYPIALDPALQITPARLAADWDADPRSHALGKLHVQRGGPEAFDPLGWIALLLITQMALSVGGNALYDLIKDLVVKQQPPAEREALRRRITVTLRADDQGGQVVVVTIDEHQSGA